MSLSSQRKMDILEEQARFSPQTKKKGRPYVKMTSPCDMEEIWQLWDDTKYYLHSDAQVISFLPFTKRRDSELFGVKLRIRMTNGRKSLLLKNTLMERIIALCFHHKHTLVSYHRNVMMWNVRLFNPYIHCITCCVLRELDYYLGVEITFLTSNLKVRLFFLFWIFLWLVFN